MPQDRVKALDELTLEDLWREVGRQELFWEETREETLRKVKLIVEGSLEAELVELLGCARYRRRQRLVDQTIREMFLAGVSASTVSRIVRSLDGEVDRFHRRPLDDRWRYLLLDGITLRQRTGVGSRKRLVLCAYGIRPDGQRELIDFRVARSESEGAWEAFLCQLRERGLLGRQLALVVSDGCAGLEAALETVYPYTRRQRCWVHKLRNVAGKLPRKLQEECLAGARRIYEASTGREAVAAYWLWARAWRAQAPKAVACLEQDLEELLAFFSCPPPQRRKVRTTNAIERAIREVRRRTRPMSCFNNEASCERVIYGVITHLNRAWEGRPLREITQDS